LGIWQLYHGGLGGGKFKIFGGIGFGEGGQLWTYWELYAFYTLAPKACTNILCMWYVRLGARGLGKMLVR